MSRLKDSLLDAAEWDSTPGKHVCAAMFDDPALRAVVASNLIAHSCSYSGKKSRRPIAAPLDVVVQRLWDGLNRHYQSANDGVGWEGGVDESVDVSDTYDLIEELVEFSNDAPSTLFDDIVAAMPMQQWSKIDPYGASYSDVMRWSWEDFGTTIKHVRRYFFDQHLGSSDRRSEKVSPLDLLQSMTAKARSYGLFRDLPAGQTYFRSRYRDTRARITDPLELGPPPAARAKQSRMSPAGIPMFYGAEDADTSVAETITAPGRYALALFQTTRPIRILDLTERPWVSIFDDRLGTLREWCRFMGRFIDDFRKPVVHDSSEHYEYTPTQVVTEFLRAGSGKHGGLDGVRYRSVQRRGGVCVVLFAERNDVAPITDGSEHGESSYLLRLIRVRNRKRG